MACCQVCYVSEGTSICVGRAFVSYRFGISTVVQYIFRPIDRGCYVIG